MTLHRERDEPGGLVHQVEVTNTAVLARWQLTQALRRPFEQLADWLSREVMG